MEPSNKDTIKTTNCSSLQPCIDTSKLNPIFVAPTRAVTRAHKSHDKLFRIKSRRLYHPANPKLLFSKNSTNPSLRICCRSYFSQQVIIDDYKEMPIKNNYCLIQGWLTILLFTQSSIQRIHRFLLKILNRSSS